MIGQAFSSEWVKALRQKRGLFWAYGFTPIAGLGIGLIGFIWLYSTNPAMAAMSAPSPMKALMDGAGVARNPVVVLFLVMGAANLFAGEYRWLTWRYMLVRNTRLNLMAAKLAVFVLLSAICLLLFMLGGLIVAAVDSAFTHVAMQPFPKGAGAAILAAFGIALLDLAGVGALVAVASVVSRTLTGAIISIIVFLLVLVFAESQAMMHQVTWAQQILPGIAYDRLMAGVMGLIGAIPRQAMLASPVSVPGAIAVLIAWLAVPAALAAALFVRQDLSRE